MSAAPQLSAVKPEGVGPQCFWAQVAESDDGCWLWTGDLDKDTYGKFWDGTKYHVAHRFAYASLIGRLTPKMELDHLCRTERCVNPFHLEEVTGRLNNFRSNSPSAINAKKTHCIHGHAFADTNMRIERSGQRRCRTCERASKRARYWRNKNSRVLTARGGSQRTGQDLGGAVDPSGSAAPLSPTPKAQR